MSKIDISYFVAHGADLIDEYFPKGKAKERGEAMLLLAMLAAFLEGEGVLHRET